MEHKPFTMFCTVQDGWISLQYESNYTKGLETLIEFPIDLLPPGEKEKLVLNIVNKSNGQYTIEVNHEN